jgi:hypothetical protein
LCDGNLGDVTDRCKLVRAARRQYAGGKASADHAVVDAALVKDILPKGVLNVVTDAMISAMP